MARKNIEKLIVNYERRLQKLMELKALEGRETSPAVLIEIEDIKAAIQELRESLEALDKSSVNRKSSERTPKLAEDTKPKQRVQIYLEGDFSLVPADRWAAAIDAFAAIMLIPPQAIEVRRIYEGSIVFDLDIPFDAAQRFRFLLEANSAQLRLLKVEKVILERGLGESEEWIAKGRIFHNLNKLSSINSAIRRMVSQLLEKGEYEQVAKFLDEAEIASQQSSDRTSTNILVAARQIYQVSSRYRDEIVRYQQATEEAIRREQELNEQLLTILALIDPSIIGSAVTSAVSLLGISSSTDPVTKSQKIQSQSLLKIYCLGAFRVYGNDQLITNWSGLKARSIFKYMIAHHGAPIAKNILMDVFWPEADPEATRRNFHQAIFSLRHTLKQVQSDFQSIQFENDCYLLNPELDIWLDYVEFEKHIQAGQSLEAAGDQAAAEIEYKQAIELYQGDFLEEDLYEDWPMLQREYLRSMFLEIADHLSEYYIQQGNYTAAIVICQKILAQDNCHEEAHRRLMECYLAQDQRRLAARQYQSCVQALKVELGVAPSPETQALYREIIEGIKPDELAKLESDPGINLQ